MEHQWRQHLTQGFPTSLQARAQYHQQVFETEAIINRFPIDLELELGTSFTEKTTYTGIYNMSGLGFDMSFRLQCSENYYGPNCTTFCDPVEGVYTCDSKGRAVCIHDNQDPTKSCTECLPGRDQLTNCTECLPGYDSSTNCFDCLPGRDKYNLQCSAFN